MSIPISVRVRCRAHPVNAYIPDEAILCGLVPFLAWGGTRQFLQDEYGLEIVGFDLFKYGDWFEVWGAESLIPLPALSIAVRVCFDVDRSSTQLALDAVQRGLVPYLAVGGSAYDLQEQFGIWMASVCLLRDEASMARRTVVLRVELVVDEPLQGEVADMIRKGFLPQLCDRRVLDRLAFCWGIDVRRLEELQGGRPVEVWSSGPPEDDLRRRDPEP